MNRNSGSIAYLVGISVILIILYIVLNTLQIQVGTMIDWITGIVAFWWLTGVTTLPWNMHFAAKDLLHEAEISEQKKITLDPEDIAYAKKQAKIFLLVAIVLHVVSAVALYLLAYYGVSSLGYFASVIAMVLTFVRPSYRLYDYLIDRLSRLRRKITYPREDVYELRASLTEQAQNISHLTYQLNLNETESWASGIGKELQKMNASLAKLDHNLSQLKQENDKAHLDLASKTHQEIAKLSEDAQFLNQAREMIRFIKNA